MANNAWWLIGLVFIVFLLDWLAIAFSWRKAECILKPLAMVLVIVWTLTASGWGFDMLIILLVVAQVFGLIGDIFLLLSPRWFLIGLSAFLAGHLMYIGMMVWHIYNSVSQNGFKSHTGWWVVLSFLLWAAMLVLFYRIIAPKSPRLTMPLMLWIPIQAYGWILGSLVVASIVVIATAVDASLMMLFLLIGALLFFTSDSLLAYDRFKRKMPKVRVWIMITYHLAQLSLAVGFLTLMGVFRG